MSNAAMGQKPPVKWMQLFLNEPLVLIAFRIKNGRP